MEEFQKIRDRNMGGPTPKYGESKVLIGVPEDFVDGVFPEWKVFSMFTPDLSIRRILGC